MLPGHDASYLELLKELCKGPFELAAVVYSYLRRPAVHRQDTLGEPLGDILGFEILQKPQNYHLGEIIYRYDDGLPSAIHGLNGQCAVNAPSDSGLLSCQMSA